ncbi:hypothetical protein [Amycolatopsis sp. NPDC004625]|uniref:hypothetical protein n=1 Tax=Amycolatopsis sp. NPDC004625 TaxID=3154670 RepID=UPI00339F8B09
MSSSERMGAPLRELALTQFIFRKVIGPVAAVNAECGCRMVFDNGIADFDCFGGFPGCFARGKALGRSLDGAGGRTYSLYDYRSGRTVIEHGDASRS